MSFWLYIFPEYDIEVISNNPLALKYEHYMNAQGLYYPSKEEQLSDLAGSTDMGNLTNEMPGIHPMFNVLNLKGKSDPSVGMHTKEFAHAAAQPLAHLATLRAAKGLAMTGVECIRDPEFLKSVKRDFEEARMV